MNPNRFCKAPWTSACIYVDTHLLCCWNTERVFIPPGEFTFDKLWNSDIAQKTRQSILDGNFSYCKPSCPVLSGNVYDTPEPGVDYTAVFNQSPTWIAFSMDESCNLCCPSCRDLYKRRVDREQHVARAIKETFDYLVSHPPDKTTIISLSGTGDPFVSKPYCNFLFNYPWNEVPHIKVNIQTNGVLLTPKVWQRLSLRYPRLDTVWISVDAATEETYRKVRVGGDWQQLWINLTHLDGYVKSHSELNPYFYYKLIYIVQEANFRELPDFIRLVFLERKLNCVVGLFVVEPWRPNPYFKHAMVHLESNPLHGEFLQMLRDPIFEQISPKVLWWGNLKAYRDKALQS